MPCMCACASEQYLACRVGMLYVGGDVMVIYTSENENPQAES